MEILNDNKYEKIKVDEVIDLSNSSLENNEIGVEMHLSNVF